MVAAFPVVKLGVLLAKQLSKPIANWCKNRAKSHPFFRQYVCMPPAQFYNWCEVKMKMWILNLGKPVTVPVLNEASAIELGASLLGEGILFTIAAIALIAEYNRSSRKEEKKEQERLEKEELLENTIHELYFTSQKQSTQINELTRLIHSIDPNKHHHHHKHHGHSEHKEHDSSDHAEHDSSHQGENNLEVKTKPKKDDPPPPPPKDKSPSTKKPCKKHHHTEEDKPNNLILKAVLAIEEDLFGPTCKGREPSLLTQAINHIYKDVYRLPLRI